MDALLPQFKMSCDEVQREVAETGTTHLAVEEMISDSDSESESSVEETSVPAVEMVSFL